MQALRSWQRLDPHFTNLNTKSRTRDQARWRTASGHVPGSPCKGRSRFESI
jgi:hypothetical protein